MLEHKAKFVGIALLFVAFSGHSLTLGRIRGAALIGQPLDMAIQVQMDAGEDAASLCFAADVFHADARQDAGRVRVTVEPAAQALTASIRVLSSAIIDEPVVTIYLRTGCGQKTTRRYVLLADLPSEVVPSSLPFVVPTTVAPSAKVAAVKFGTTASVDSVDSRSASARTQRAAPKAVARTAAVSTSPTVSKPVNVSTQGPARTEAKHPAPPLGSVSAPSMRKSGSGRPRLKLDPLELLSDRVANLDSFMNFEPSEDALRERQKVQKLEADVMALRDAAARSQVNLLDLRARLQKAEEQRLPGSMVYALFGVVLVGLLAAGWYWYRQRQKPSARDDWWSASGSMSMPPPPPETGPRYGAPISTQLMKPEGGTKSRRAAGDAGVPAEIGSLSEEVDVTLIDMSDSHFDHFMPVGESPGTPRRASRSTTASATTPHKVVHDLHAEAVLETRRQAEALAALGKTDQAVRALKKQIGESEEPNPFVYLDLFGLFHSLGLTEEFRQFRQDFKLLFNGRVPDFAFFRDEGKGLEAYPGVLSRLTGLWGKPKVLDAIETLIFRDPWVNDAQVFDLAAFRELLLLHGIAHAAVLRTTPDTMPAATAGAWGSPLVRRDSVEARDTMPAPSHLSAPDSEHASGLDLDLSDSELGRLSPAEGASGAGVDLPLLMPLELVPEPERATAPGTGPPAKTDGK